MLTQVIFTVTLAGADKEDSLLAIIVEAKKEKAKKRAENELVWN